MKNKLTLDEVKEIYKAANMEPTSGRRISGGGGHTPTSKLFGCLTGACSIVKRGLKPGPDLWSQVNSDGSDEWLKEFFGLSPTPIECGFDDGFSGDKKVEFSGWDVESREAYDWAYEIGATLRAEMKAEERETRSALGDE